MMSRRQGNTTGENPSRTSKLPAERVVLLVLAGLLAAALIVIYRLSFVLLDTCQHFQTLKEENEALRKNLSDSGSQNVTAGQRGFPPPDSVKSWFKDDTCVKNRADWEAHEGNCYYFNLMPLSWEESRQECRCRGSDLVKVDSRDEQTFLVEKLKTKILHPEDKFWIGLTDSKKEGSWLWVDGSPLDKRLSFWFGTEPDNWTEKNKDGEDCVRMGNHDVTDLECWYDQSCLASQKSICEKAAGTSSSGCV
ncbi:hepatic lectin-like isoform X1 [Poecilia latipinna]|uniref:hepatic lectin-like isoform X1 n=1 Tax=Poecilia latipinna TaxID=48699 RepID=UPI00072DFFA1|nr:PREDICTED: hepatic lectin-like isoform X1 [Poecilia latipinna]